MSAGSTLWIWDKVNKNIDVNIDESGFRKTRNNWVLTRYMLSDEEYETQQGQEAIDISAYAGANLITETAGGAIGGLSFDTLTAWTDPSYIYIPEQSFYWSAGGSVYYPFQLMAIFTEKPDPVKNSIVRPYIYWSGGWKCQWEIAQWSDDSWQPTYTKTYKVVSASSDPPDYSAVGVIPATVPQDYKLSWIDEPSHMVWTGRLEGLTTGNFSDFTFLQNVSSNTDVITVDDFSVTLDCDLFDTDPQLNDKYTFRIINEPSYVANSNYARSAAVSVGSGYEPSTIPDLSGQVFNVLSGTYTGTATATVTGGSGTGGILYCSSDAKSYEDQGVEWHRRNQTWIFKDNFQ